MRQETRDIGQEGCRTGGIQDRRNVGREGCRTGGMQDNRDTGQEGYRIQRKAKHSFFHF